MTINMIAFTAFLVMMLPIGSDARKCLTNETDPLYAAPRSLTVTSSDQIIPLDDCETIIGDIRIHRDFHGSLILNNVTNFTGSILDEFDADNDGLEAIEMLNLLSIKGITLYRSRGLRSIHMPRLVSIMSQLDFIQGPEDSWMDFSALKSVYFVDIAGTWTNVSFPALEWVGSAFWIFTDPSWEIAADRTDSVDIDLPNLTKVRDLKIVGHVRRLHDIEKSKIRDTAVRMASKEDNQRKNFISILEIS